MGGKYHIHRLRAGSLTNPVRLPQGFTMIELLVSIMILSVALAGMFTFLWGASSYWQKGKDIADVNDSARIGLNRMTREIRQASQIISADDNHVSFTVDFAAGQGQETISYWFEAGSPGSIWREDDRSGTGPQLVLFNNVSSLSLAYYGNDYRCDTNNDGVVPYTELQGCGGIPGKIARVDINIVMIDRNGQTETFVDQAWLRNRAF